jgi:hypothetical protein
VWRELTHVEAFGHVVPGGFGGAGVVLQSSGLAGFLLDGDEQGGDG